PFVDGQYRQSISTELCDNLNPATERAICQFSVGSAADVDNAVRVARRRFEDGCWSERPAHRRGEVLLKLADLIVKHRDLLALLDTLEMGKPIVGSLQDAGHFAPTLLRSWAGFADKMFGSCAPPTRNSLSFNVYEPR